MPWEVMAKNVNVYEIIECFTIWCVYVSERQCAVAKCESDGGYAKRCWKNWGSSRSVISSTITL